MGKDQSDSVSSADARAETSSIEVSASAGRFKRMTSARKQSAVLRLLREHNLSAWLGQGTPRGSKAHDGTIIPQTIDTMWGTDMTTTVTLEEGQAAVFIAYYHCSGECVGIHASRGQNRWEALEPIRQGADSNFKCND